MQSLLQLSDAQYLARVQAVHVTVLFRELEFVPVRGYKAFKWVADKCEDEGVGDGRRDLALLRVEVLRSLVESRYGYLEKL